jgi:hypothetical protein
MYPLLPRHIVDWAGTDVDFFPAEQWNGVVELLPRWMAPNLVTLVGFFFIIGNVALLELYVPDFVGPVSW